MEAEHQKRLEEAFARFQEAFRRYGEALLGGRAEVRRTARGLGLVVTPAGKRTQDLRLLSLGEKTLGALAFLFALGNSKAGFPSPSWTKWTPPWTRRTSCASRAFCARGASSSW